MSRDPLRVAGNRPHGEAASFLDLPERTQKPRRQGLTCVLDRGLSLADVDGLVEVAGHLIDLVKLGWGTAVVTQNLEEKLARYRQHGIPVVLGGTLTEVSIAQGRVAGLVAWLQELGLEHVEVSDGAIRLPHGEKLALIDRLAPSSPCCPRSARRTTREAWRRPNGSGRSSASSRPARGG
ncbi:MAG: phosphosulfolactate synthase [Solirubrobacteraceae bacterium]|nr:phosphosulfolactate synthase [Solirubrobacteraceae bacterium]